MKPSSLLPIVLASVLSSGCECFLSHQYTHLRVTNYRDELVADWIARGYVVPLERGYEITAVERRTAPPYPQINYYPDGWRTVVVGPHIHHWHCPKPRWLADYQGDVPALTSWTDKYRSSAH